MCCDWAEDIDGDPDRAPGDLSPNCWPCPSDELGAAPKVVRIEGSVCLAPAGSRDVLVPFTSFVLSFAASFSVPTTSCPGRRPPTGSASTFSVEDNDDDDEMIGAGLGAAKACVLEPPFCCVVGLSRVCKKANG